MCTYGPAWAHFHRKPKTEPNRTEPKPNRIVVFSVFWFGFGFLLGELRSSASASVLSSNQTDPPKNRCLVRKVKKSAVRHAASQPAHQLRPTNTPSPRRPHACTHHSQSPRSQPHPKSLALSFARERAIPLPRPHPTAATAHRPGPEPSGTPGPRSRCRRGYGWRSSARRC